MKLQLFVRNVEKLAFCHDTSWVVFANAKTFKIVFIIAKLRKYFQPLKNIFYPVGLKIFFEFYADIPPHTCLGIKPLPDIFEYVPLFTYI